MPRPTQGIQQKYPTVLTSSLLRGSCPDWRGAASIFYHASTDTAIYFRLPRIFRAAPLTTVSPAVIIRANRAQNPEKLNHLIKSGGGNGPMKPRQPAFARCQIRRSAQDEESEAFSSTPQGVLFSFWQQTYRKRGKNYGKPYFYIRIRY